MMEKKLSKQNCAPCAGKQGNMQRFTEICLLLLLYKEKCYGYNLSEQLSQFDLGDINASTLYRTLRKMDNSAWVTSKWQKSEKGPERRVYQITDKGREELTDWMAVLQQRKKRIDTVLSTYKLLIEEK